MESDTSPEGARDALDLVDSTRGATLDRMTTPWWAYPLAGTIWAGVLAVHAYYSTDVVVRVAVAGVVVLGLALRARWNRRGVRPHQQPPTGRARNLQVAFAVAMALVFGLLWVLVDRLDGSPVALVVAAVSGAAVAVASWLFDLAVTRQCRPAV